MKDHFPRFSHVFLLAGIAVIVSIATVFSGLGTRATPTHASTSSTYSGLADAPTPPMGWDAWNFSHCKTYNYDKTYFHKVADSFVSTSMGSTSLKAAGYNYIMLACVEATIDGSGNLVPTDTTKFPNGFQPIIDYIHSLGMKVEFYAVPGPNYCGDPPTPTPYPAYGHETAVATAFAAKKIDAFKYDLCGATQSPPDIYARMRDALKATGRPMIMEMSEYGIANPWTWGPVTGTFWRTATDIDDNTDTGIYKVGSCWNCILRNLDANDHPAAAGPGGWNFPDMLEVGVPGDLTTDEHNTQMAMWAIMASPLWLGNDTLTMTQSVYTVLTNPEVIAIDQDPLGAQGVLISGTSGTPQVWSKRLQQSNTRAVALLNRTSMAAPITVNFGDIGLTGTVSVRDAWNRQDRGNASGSYTLTVAPHATALLKLTGTEGPQTGAVATWEFEENTGNRAGDSAGSGSYGTITGATWQSGYNGGYALNFQPTNSATVNVGHPQALNFTGAITVGGWIWADSASSEKVIIGKAWDGTTTPWWLSIINPTTIRFGHYQNGLVSADASVKYSLLGGWHHVVGQYDGSSYKVYIDGQFISSTPSSVGITTSNTDVTIGSINETDHKYFSGTIDQIHVYNRALSLTEIQNWYASRV